MTETINIASLAIMCEGKDIKPFPLDPAPPPYSPRCEELQRMRDELDAARRCLAEKDEKMCKLSRIQDTVDAEVQELTEKLFQEAYKMVNVAEEKRERAEKLLAESRLQVDVLTAEVAALKVLVQAPGMGRNHFQNTSPEHKSALAKLFSSSSNSSTKKTASSSSTTSKKSNSLPSSLQENREKERDAEQKEADAVEEVDPILFGEFASWRDAGHPAANHPFVDRIQLEEVGPCMEFKNKQLSDGVLDSMASNMLEVEPVNEEKPSVKTCALTQVSRFCPYRVRTSSDSEWHQISLLARNRLAAVCDYFTFLRYLHLGLIKSGMRDSYFDLITLRKNMSLAKLGLGFVPKTNLRPSM
ncbi:unnamed protein product [Auanema sp. JU1783]|nr:unnamed protein product [Auanema sp. JU1783]